jgi:hypothetical protein
MVQAVTARPSVWGTPEDAIIDLLKFVEIWLLWMRENIQAIIIQICIS